MSAKLPENPPVPRIVYNFRQIVLTALKAGGLQHLEMLKRTFGCESPTDFFMRLSGINLRIEGGDGTTQEQAIEITGKIDCVQGPLLEHVLLFALRGTNRFHQKALVESDDKVFDCFKFDGKPDIWIEITNWYGRDYPMDS